MKGEDQTVTLSESDWIRVRSVMEYGIERLEHNDMPKNAKSRRRILGEIEEQTKTDDRTSMASTVEKIKETHGKNRSRRAEETGRSVAHLQD